MSIKVLIVEDDPDWQVVLRKSLATILSTMSPDIVTCSDGAQAVAELRKKEKVALVSVDMNLSNLYRGNVFEDGATAWDVLDELAKRRHKETGVIVFTALPYDAAMGPVSPGADKLWEVQSFLMDKIGNERSLFVPKPNFPELPNKQRKAVEIAYAEKSVFDDQTMRSRIRALARTDWSTATKYVLTVHRDFYAESGVQVDVRPQGPGKRKHTTITHQVDAPLLHTLAYLRMAHQLGQRPKSNDWMDVWEAREFLNGSSNQGIMERLSRSLEKKTAVSGDKDDARTEARDACRTPYAGLKRRLRDQGLDPDALITWSGTGTRWGLRLSDNVKVRRADGSWEALIGNQEDGYPVQLLLAPSESYRTSWTGSLPWDYYEIGRDAAEAASGGRRDPGPSGTEEPTPATIEFLKKHPYCPRCGMGIWGENDYEKWEYCPTCGEKTSQDGHSGLTCDLCP